MTNEKALKRMKAMIKCTDCSINGSLNCEECAECNKAGNTQEILDVLKIAYLCIEKQIPKKPKKYGINRLCPVCEWNVFPEIENAYCYKCGQALDWRKENETD